MVIQINKGRQKYSGVPKVKQQNCWLICYSSRSKISPIACEMASTTIPEETRLATSLARSPALP